MKRRLKRGGGGEFKKAPKREEQKEKAGNRKKIDKEPTNKEGGWRRIERGEGKEMKEIGRDDIKNQ